MIRSPARAIRSCPICGKPRAEAFTPFCSSRCRDRDLMQWLADGYALPGPPADPEAIAPDPRDGDNDA